MSETIRKMEPIYDPTLTKENLAGSMRLDTMARDHVINKFDYYKQLRNFIRGGKQVQLTYDWDERYRIYKAIFLQSDHNYRGESKVFNPILRKAVNIVESEAGNAIFGRSGSYFSVDANGTDPENDMMSREAFGMLSYYSNLEDYVYNYELSMKQALIYDSTCVETILDRETSTGVYRQKVIEPILDPETNAPMVDQKGNPSTRTTFKLRRVSEDRPTVKIEVRDIYRIYINHLQNDPEKDDIIYRDSKSPQQLLELAERGVYKKSAVMKLIKMQPTFGNMSDSDVDNSGEGKSFIGDQATQQDPQAPYEILRFQGLFTIRDEKTNKKMKVQYWIDIGERQHVLQIIESPIIGGFKTFSLCNYDSMVGEFNSDSVISPYKALQFEMNDKENQSLDGLSFQLNAPFEVITGSGIKQSDLLKARKMPNVVLFSKMKDSVKKLDIRMDLNHLNGELIRLASMIDNGTGATNLAAGAPTGTQVDRSGKAIGELLNQTRSQFSKFVRKFEKRLIERSLQKTWDMLIQFFDDEILIEVLDKDGTSSSKLQSPAQIVGQFKINVSAGSQFLKNRDYRDAILEFFSIASTSDEFMELLDKPEILGEVAESLNPKLKKFINPDNVIQKLKGQVAQLTQITEKQGEINKDVVSENKRLTNELKQTDRANMANPGIADINKLKNN